MGSVSLEKADGFIARFHPVGGFGDPYPFVAFVEIHGDTAEVKGAAGVFSPWMLTALRRAMRAEGVKRLTWERKHQHPHEVVVAV